MQTELTSAQQAAVNAESTQQELSQVQAELKALQGSCHTLQQELQASKAELEALQGKHETLQQEVRAAQPVDGAAGPQSQLTSPSLSRQQSAWSQTLDQPSASMTTTEADLVEAASEAIQAQVSTLARCICGSSANNTAWQSGSACFAAL